MKITTKLNKNYINFYLSNILYRLNGFNEFDEIHIFELEIPYSDKSRGEAYSTMFLS